VTTGREAIEMSFYVREAHAYEVVKGEVSLRQVEARRPVDE